MQIPTYSYPCVYMYIIYYIIVYTPQCDSFKNNFFGNVVKTKSIDVF